MSFNDADAYGQFMGRYSDPLADALLGVIEITPGTRALDVGCGTGVLTGKLVERLGAAAVTAVDPSEQFVDAVRQALPGVEVMVAGAEQLPFNDDEFALSLAQLVVHFMTRPLSGISEMARVTKPGGTVAASVWDFAGDRSPLSTFWRAARQLDAGVHDESALPGAAEGSLENLFLRAGLGDVTESELQIRVPFSGFDEWWSPFTLGVGPAGDHLAGLGDNDRLRLERACAELLPDGPFDITAVAWLAVGTK
ncbi:MAG: methyltransferase domain-containing protein [Rhodoglobus sp.]